MNTEVSENKEPSSKWLEIGLTIDHPRDPDHTAKMMRMRSQITVIGATRQYEKTLKKSKFSPLTIKQYGYCLDDLRKHFGYARVSEITRRELDKFLRAVHRRVLPITYAHKSRVYWQFFEYCRENNYCLYNYVRKFSLVSPKNIRFFLPRQVEFIFATLPHGELRDACAIIYGTGIPFVDLSNIVQVDYAHSKLMLKDRAVNCPQELLTIAASRRRWHLTALEKKFIDFLRQHEMTGNLRYMQNTYVARAAMAGTPLEVIQNQVGFESKNGAKTRVNRVLKSRGYREILLKTPYKHFI